ncbi:MAG: twin-arginine translocase TatA/TatE family subunit [Flammeovirgaceae bacterium]|nr:twin-arginine translocase TatA/TatE family subunit [Flammeovirgaceae bacterium]
MKSIAFTLLFGMPGGWEWVIIILVILLLFGAKKIPELARGLGRGIREFKEATKEIQQEVEQGAKEVKKQNDEIAKTIERQG